MPEGFRDAQNWGAAASGCQQLAKCSALVGDSPYDSLGPRLQPIFCGTGFLGNPFCDVKIPNFNVFSWPQPVHAHTWAVQRVIVIVQRADQRERARLFLEAIRRPGFKS